jgi:hypothetical protein
MQDILSQLHRRDAMIKVSVMAIFAAIVLSVAAPFVAPQAAPPPIPPFKPYRAQETAQLAPSADLFHQISAD